MGLLSEVSIHTRNTLPALSELLQQLRIARPRCVISALSSSRSDPNVRVLQVRRSPRRAGMAEVGCRERLGTDTLSEKGSWPVELPLLLLPNVTARIELDYSGGNGTALAEVARSRALRWPAQAPLEATAADEETIANGKDSLQDW